MKTLVILVATASTAVAMADKIHPLQEKNGRIDIRPDENGHGEFHNARTGERFEPYGFNYIVLGKVRKAYQAKESNPGNERINGINALRITDYTQRSKENTMRCKGVTAILFSMWVLTSPDLLAGHDPLEDAVFRADFADQKGTSGDYHLRHSGAVRMGVPCDPAETPASTHCAEFSGGWLEVVDGRKIPLNIGEAFSLCVTFKIDAEAGDGILLDWWGHDATGKPRSISLEWLTPGFVNRSYLTAIIDNFYAVSVPSSLVKPGQWHTAVVRIQDGKAQLFVDGVIRDERRANQRFDHVETGPQVLHKRGFLMGADLRETPEYRGENVFHGKLAQVAMWNRSLADTEIGAVSGKTAVETNLVYDPPGEQVVWWKWGLSEEDLQANPVLVGQFKPRAYTHLTANPGWALFYDHDLDPEAARERMYADHIAFYRRALQEDKYFPRYHPMVPGSMTNPKGAYVHDTWRLFPCSHINWNTFTYPDTHYWYHLASEDLVSWKFMPLPQWIRPEAGNVVEVNGAGMAFTNPRVKYLSRDPDLADWEKAPRMEIPPVKPPVMDYFAFPYQNQWYLLGGHARFANNPEVPKLKLFRAKDASLDSWEYLGPFYHGNYEQGARTAHHPYIFFIGGKAVVGSGIPVEGGHQYLIGRIENDRFVAEGRGAYGFAEQGPMTRQIWNANVNAGERAVTWRWLQDSGMVRLARDVVRDGWGTTNSIPREITLDAADDTLRFAPAREMQKLREGRLVTMPEVDLAADQVCRLKTTGKTGQIEVVCKVKPGPEGAAGIQLEDAFGNPVRFYVDAAASELRLEYGQAQYDGSNLRVRTHRVPIQDPTGERELRLFFDRSVIEAYSEGLCSMGRWYPDNPDGLEVSLFSENAGATFNGIDVWRMGTIWKEYQ